MVTMLRDPVDRFLSEFKHVQRGATWEKWTYICNSKRYQPPLCFKGTNWSNVTLTEFLDCPYNMASNRQTRMLANLTWVGCRHVNAFPLGRKHGKVMLESAKQNLRSMAYFGLLEYQKESQYLFEKTFALKFKKDFSQRDYNTTFSREARQTLSPRFLLLIRKANRLDRQLYSYAKALFFKRLNYLQRMDETN